MIKVNILFFGATAETTGEREIEMDFAVGVKSSDALAEIKEKFPQLNEPKLLFAVNQEYANGDESVGNGDELAVFTAVSGG